ncbi:MAG TPA: hypothetical protein PK014_12285 [Thermoanaerobaculia bacterium]|nr:hypothetical protein [Thermoanaerobaculia bacterium]HUM30841.1 hypothetical protein [Thermoanaerobaculia bacterium]HXK69178.1 hypothetical protein [Thermoanaerobaculia bacterium]
MAVNLHDRELILRFHGLLRTTEVYPPGNVTLIQARKGFLEVLKEAGEKDGSPAVRLDRIQDHFMVNGRIVKSDLASFTAFSRFLVMLKWVGITGISMNVQLTDESMDTLVRAILHDAHSREEKRILPTLHVEGAELEREGDAPEIRDSHAHAVNLIEMAARLIVAHGRLLNDLVQGRHVDGTLIRRMVQELIDSLAPINKPALILLSAFADDEALASHAVCQAFLTSLLFADLDISREVTQNVTMATLFAQVGNMLVPAEVLKKRGELSEEEKTLLSSVPLNSLQLLLSMKNIGPSGILRLIAAYETRRPVPSSHPYVALIQVICDYEAMVSHRSYRLAIHPREAIQALDQGRGARYASYAVDILLRYLGPWPPGSTGLLDDKPAVVLDEKRSAIFVNGGWNIVPAMPQTAIPLHRFPVNPASAMTVL